MCKNLFKRGGMRTAFSMVLFSFFVLICPLALFAQVEDTTPPTIQSLAFTPKTVDVSAGSQSITVTTRITDNLSGFYQGWFGFNSPTGTQGTGAWFSGSERISGDSNDGLYEFEVHIPQFSEAGDWRVPNFQIYDSTWNFGNYSGDELSARGFPTILSVSENQNPFAIETVGPGTFWIGLKNTDDQGTQFDLRTELYLNDTLVSEGQTLCITGVTRNPTYAKEVTVPFSPISNGTYDPGDVLSLRVLTRVGTNPDGSKCPGHNSAVGLRLYYDSRTRTSAFGIEKSPDSMRDYFLHSASGAYFLDDASPTGTVKYKDSSGVNYNNGDPWKEIGTWSMTLP